MSLIFGYDEFIDGEALTNAYKFKDGKSPPNLGFAGYRLHDRVRDFELHLISATHSIIHNHHYFGLCKYFDIEVKKVDEIKDRYYYVIDVYPNEFWTELDSRSPNISGQAISDIRNGKAKILILFPLEAIRKYYDVVGLLNAWESRYNLPPKSIVLTSGNYSFGKEIKGTICSTYIPYSQWEHTFLDMYDKKTIKNLFKAITRKVRRKKVFLNYNRRARYYRCKLVYELKEAGVMKYGLVSLGMEDGERHSNISNDFYETLPITFDKTDLEINHATELIVKDFLNAYVSVVSETIVDPGELFPTEKIFKAIVGIHPFIVVASPGFLELLKGFGYKTFSNWFDESYDLEYDLDKRIGIIVAEIKRLTLKSESELQNMLLDMLPTLKHNLNTFLRRTKEKTFQEQLEAELWK